jgi:hypothetical protein
MVAGEDVMGLPSSRGSRAGRRWSTCGRCGFIPNPGPAAPPLVELAGGMAGHLLAWERHERMIGACEELEQARKTW